MNERIKKLIEECTFIYDDLVYNGTDSYMETSEYFDKEKFAELIVKECRYVMDCNKGSDRYPAWNQALSETSEKIKQHFGVEE